MPTPFPIALPTPTSWGPPTEVTPYIWVAVIAAVIHGIMLFSGHGDHDIGHDMDHDVGHDLDHGIDNDHPLQLLSLRTALAFLTAFGAVGGIVKSYYFPHIIAAPIGAIAGIFAALIVAVFMRWLKNQQRNSSISLAQTEGQIGTVVERIPPGGVGRVKLRVGDEPIEKDGRLEDPTAELPIGALVTIVVASSSHFIVRLRAAEVAAKDTAMVTTVLKEERGVKD